MSKYKCIKEHNNYDVKLNEIIEANIYKNGWIVTYMFSGSGQILRANCFEEVTNG